MPYSDLLTDAVIYAPLNNSMALTTTGTATQFNWTGTHIFVNDAPAATGNTHSLRFNNYTSDPGFYKFNNLPAATNAITVTGWVKFVTDPNIALGTNLGSALTVLSQAQQFSSTSYLRVSNSGATYSNTLTSSLAVDRRLNVVWHYGGTNQTSGNFYSNSKIELNKWHHIAFVLRNPGQISAVDYWELAVYIDGVCSNYQFGTSPLERLTFNSNFTSFPLFSTAIETVANTKLGSNFAFWHRALTIDEIRAQAWYGHDNEDYNTVVLADNPTYYATLDNPNKATNHTVYGATDWGSLSDDVTGIYVNELGPNNSKAWRLSSTADTNQNRTVNIDPDMLQGISNLYKSGEFSIEFWFKNSIRPPNTRHLFGIVANTGINNSVGAFFFELDNTGRIGYRGSYKSGATTYISGSLLATQIDTPTTGQEILTLHPGQHVNGFTDNNWHHVIYTHSNTQALGTVTAGATTYTGLLYIDGCKVGERNWTTTFGWVDGTGVSDGLHIGPSTTALTNGDGYLSNIAFYPYRMSEDKIRNHFKVGKDYVSEYGVVKYYNGTSWVNATATKTWNGTAWIDWSKKYYDGTQWVTI
jgi:hypothetical protein